jgi:hypothetical protein
MGQKIRPLPPERGVQGEFTPFILSQGVAMRKKNLCLSALSIALVPLGVDAGVSFKWDEAVKWPTAL